MNKNKELECILFCEFHPIAGPKIVYQVRCGFGTDTMPDGRTDRQTDRQTERQTDGQTDRQRDRQTDRQTDRIFTFAVQASFGRKKK